MVVGKNKTIIKHKKTGIKAEVISKISKIEYLIRFIRDNTFKDFIEQEKIKITKAVADISTFIVFPKLNFVVPDTQIIYDDEYENEWEVVQK